MRGFAVVTAAAAAAFFDLLKIWFQNPFVRDAVYHWEEDVKPQGSAVDYAAMRELQQTFVHLCKSKKASYNPMGFVDALSLSHVVQQDGQEFCKLFTSILERQLSTPEDRNVMHQYRGKYCYETKCHNCQTPSSRDSVFYELELQTKGHKTLDGCLAAYFEAEELKGSNQYQCSPCGSKQDASRGIKLMELPAVLSLHLLRFYYDLKTMNKKKLNQFLQYPETLNLAAYMPAGTALEDALYRLQAVLMHRGPNASSGHYVARVNDLANGKWIELDDTAAFEIDARGVGLGDRNELGVGGGKATLKGKAKSSASPEGSHRCKNVYMLVYRSEKSIPAAKKTLATTPAISKLLDEAVAADNLVFETDRNAKIAENTEIVSQEQELSKSIAGHYERLLSTASTPPGDTQWIPTKWLEEWLANAGCKEKMLELKPIDANSLKCMHGKMDPEKVSDAKRVRKEGLMTLNSELFTTNADLTQTIPGDQLCSECVRTRFKTELLQRRLEHSQAKVDAILKPLRSLAVSDGFWITKDSLRYWKTKTFKCEEGTKFNSAASCKHDKLMINEQYLRVVPAEVWSVISNFCGEAQMVSFPTGTDSCADCRLEKAKESAVNETAKIRALAEKESLPQLYRKSKRPGKSNFAADIDDGFALYAVTTEFVQSWKAWCRQSNDHERPTLTLQPLLCDHGRFIYDVDLDDPTPATTVDVQQEGFQYTTAQEWAVLSKEYDLVGSCASVKVTRTKDLTGLVSDPECCSECRTDRLKASASSRLLYVDAVLWMRKVDATVQNATVKDPTAESTLTSQSNSSRRAPRPGKGCSRLHVDSTTTIDDLRVMVMHAFNVMPRDQHIWFGELELDNPAATLGSYQVPEKSELLLTIDPEVGFDDGTQIESGFAGTSLLSAPVGGNGSTNSIADDDVIALPTPFASEPKAHAPTSEADPIVIDDDDDDDTNAAEDAVRWVAPAHGNQPARKRARAAAAAAAAAPPAPSAPAARTASSATAAATTTSTRARRKQRGSKRGGQDVVASKQTEHAGDTKRARIERDSSEPRTGGAQTEGTSTVS
jgi:ubiquitin carboxyl-terminal hydrolase 48